MVLFAEKSGAYGPILPLSLTPTKHGLRRRREQIQWTANPELSLLIHGLLTATAHNPDHYSVRPLARFRISTSLSASRSCASRSTSALCKLRTS